MLCSMCNTKDAVEEKTVDLGYGKVHVFLCEDCASKVKENEPEPTIEVLDFWTQDEYKLVCPNCKATASDIEKTNYVGCEKCYQMFEPEIERALTIIQGKSTHVGKVPNSVMNKNIESIKKNQKNNDIVGKNKFNPDDFNKKFFGGGR